MLFSAAHTSVLLCIRQHTSAYVCIRQLDIRKVDPHTSACVSIRQHTSAYVSMTYADTLEHTAVDSSTSSYCHTTIYVRILPTYVSSYYSTCFCAIALSTCHKLTLLPASPTATDHASADKLVIINELVRNLLL